MSSSSGKEKFYWIAIAVCVLLSLIFLVFAYIQKAAADNALQRALQNERKAIEQEKLAQQNAVQTFKMMDKLKKAEQTIREKDSIIAVLKKRK